MQNYSTPPKKISLLNEHSYQIYLNAAPDGIGHTHQAIINDGHQNYTVYASYYPIATHPKSLVNEITAYILATALNLPIPPKAFIVVVKAHYLQSIDAKLSFQNPDQLCPLWCVSTLPGNSPKIHYNLKNIQDNPVFKADIAAWKQALNTVVFDNWLGNSDRNVGNLIRTGKQQYALIDHEDIAVNRRWQPHHLQYDGEIPNKLAHILWGGYTINDPKQINRMMHLADEALSANIHVLQELVYWWKLLLTENELTALHRFIMKRATLCQNHIAERFGALL